MTTLEHNCGAAQPQAFRAAAPIGPTGFLGCTQTGAQCPTFPSGDCTFFGCPTIDQAGAAGPCCTQGGPKCPTQPNGDCTFFGNCPPTPATTCTQTGPQCPSQFGSGCPTDTAQDCTFGCTQFSPNCPTANPVCNNPNLAARAAQPAAAGGAGAQIQRTVPVWQCWSPTPATRCFICPMPHQSRVPWLCPVPSPWCPPITQTFICGGGGPRPSTPARRVFAEAEASSEVFTRGGPVTRPGRLPFTMTKNDLIHYLLERGLLDRRAVVDGDVTVVEGARRHHNYSVIRRQGTGLFVKRMQPDQAFSAQTLQKEAACYVMMESDPALAEIHALMPRFRAYDPDRHLLVLELIGDGENLSELHRRVNGFPEDIARRVGELLARYHEASSRDLLPRASTAIFQGQPPGSSHFTSCRAGRCRTSARPTGSS